MMDAMQTIIKREFERVCGDDYVTQVEFTEDEQIIVTTLSGLRYVMTIGSDDDEFVFHLDCPGTGHQVSFPFPPDWVDAIDENNFS